MQTASAIRVGPRHSAGPAGRPASALNVSDVIDMLADHSQRPRYAFLTLSLLVELAGPAGKAGPFVVDEDQQEITLRDYIAKRLARMSARDTRRRKLAERVRQELAARLPEDEAEAQAIIDAEVAERARIAGANNFSRVVSELERMKMLTRYYAGFRVSHEHRGGLRNLVCQINPEIIAAFRRRDLLV